MNNNIPVITYHSVGPRIPGNRIFYGLRLDLKTFENHLKVLKNDGFNSLFLSEVYNASTLPRKPIVITFDDGYLDNWTHVYPLLKKYGLKATIFISLDFVSTNQKLRPTLFDIWDGSIREADLCHQGFLSWAEMREMESEGIIDIQSHAKTHTWYFNNKKIIDFIHPTSIYKHGYEWIVWNTHPELKPFYLNMNLEPYIKYGTPVYQYGKSLQVKRYFPGKNTEEYLTEFIENNGGEHFFTMRDWKNTLHTKALELEKDETGGYFESDQEYADRIYTELDDPRRIIKKKLGKDVYYLCWPGGSINKINLKIAEEVGYTATTAPSTLISSNENLIRRISTPAITIKDRDSIYDTIYYGGTVLRLAIKAYSGSNINKQTYRIMIGLLKKVHNLKVDKTESYYIRR